MHIKNNFNNLSAPVFRSLVLISNLVLFRLYSSYFGAEGVAFINALTSLYSYWIVADYGLLSIVVREKAKFGNTTNFISLKRGLGGQIFKCATTVWILSSALIFLNSDEKNVNFQLYLMIIINFIFYISLLTSIYERQVFAFGRYSSILVIQIVSHILIIGTIYLLHINNQLSLYLTAIFVTLIPFITNVICYYYFKNIIFNEKFNNKAYKEKKEKLINGGHLYFFMLTGFSIIGNSYDVYLFYRHTSPENTATMIGVLKIITPFYSLLQSFIIIKWPIWENKLYISRNEALPIIIEEIKKMQINCIALSAPFLLTFAIFGTFFCKFILNLDITDIGILYGICLYRLCTAYVEPLPIVLTTEGFIKKYVWIVGVLNLILILVKWIWLEYINSEFLYLFLICGILNLFFIGYLGRLSLAKMADSITKDGLHNPRQIAS